MVTRKQTWRNETKKSKFYEKLTHFLRHVLEKSSHFMTKMHTKTET